MAKYELIDYIVKKFGGEKKKDLRALLLELLEGEFEIIFQQKKLNSKQITETQKYHIISDIMNFCSSDYDKCIRIIERLYPGKWYNLIIIPDKLRIEFFNQATIHHGIEFKTVDLEEFFRIVDE